MVIAILALVRGAWLVPLLISLVLYGIAATFIALLLERFGSWLLGRYFPENSTPYNVLMYFGVVAFSEEGAKYFLLKRRTWRSAAFNCQFDGVVYAVFVAQFVIPYVRKLPQGWYKTPEPGTLPHRTEHSIQLNS